LAKTDPDFSQKPYFLKHGKLNDLRQGNSSGGKGEGNGLWRRGNSFSKDKLNAPNDK